VLRNLDAAGRGRTTGASAPRRISKPFAILQLWPTVRAALLRRESGGAAWPAPSPEKAAILKSHDQGRLSGGCRIGADARPNWREQPARESLTGAQWR
jgi:hypothetical protein